MRGVEPLSEGSLAGPSPSADCDLKFPHDDARSQASAIGSFMLRTHGKAYMRSFPAWMALGTGQAGRPGQRRA